MVRFACLLALAIALPALTLAKFGHQDRNCTIFTVPVAVSANNTAPRPLRVDSTVDAVNFVSIADTWSLRGMLGVVTPLPINDTFNINAQLCVPAVKHKAANQSEVLIIATHGIGFDKKYWDVDLHPEKYSFVDAALEAGYSILTYDRLGTGRSSKPDAYTVVQPPVEVEILRGLTDLARTGKLFSFAKNAQFPSPTAGFKIAHIGHSFGSILTSGFLAKYGSKSDGAILTGFALTNQVQNIRGSSFGWEFAKESDCSRFGDRGSGYVVQRTKASVQQIFLKKGMFDLEMLDYAVKIRETATLGEMGDNTALFGAAVGFKGPIQIFLAEYDYIICAGDCKGAYDPVALAKPYYQAKDVNIYIQPGTAHGLTLHNNATAGYRVMLSYLNSQGL